MRDAIWIAAIVHYRRHRAAQTDPLIHPVNGVGFPYRFGGGELGAR
jgi:hypothetical protein